MFQKEDFSSQLIKDLAILIAMHRDEVSLMPVEVKTEPAWEIYEKVAEAGHLHIYTLRDEGMIVGYAVYLTHVHMHYVSQMIAEPDVIYLMPTARKGMSGRNLIRFAEADLRALGVNEMRQVVKPSVRDFGPLLKRDGYEATDIIYTKRLQ